MCFLSENVRSARGRQHCTLKSSLRASSTSSVIHIQRRFLCENVRSRSLLRGLNTSLRPFRRLQRTILFPKRLPPERESSFANYPHLTKRLPTEGKFACANKPHLTKRLYTEREFPCASQPHLTKRLPTEGKFPCANQPHLTKRLPTVR